MKKLGKSIEGFCFFILSLDKLHSLKIARLSNSSASMEKPSCQSYLVSNKSKQINCTEEIFLIYETLYVFQVRQSSKIPAL